MSIAHVVGDAFTYYTFLNMLGDDQDVKVMRYERNLEIMSKVSELKGNLDDNEWLNSKASIIRGVNTLGKPSSVLVYDFNNNWIEEEKKKILLKKLLLFHPMILPVLGFIILQNQMSAQWFSIIEKEFKNLLMILQVIMLLMLHIKFLIIRLHNSSDNHLEIKKTKIYSEE
jgi:hypothetical protein